MKKLLAEMENAETTAQGNYLTERPKPLARPEQVRRAPETSEGKLLHAVRRADEVFTDIENADPSKESACKLEMLGTHLAAVFTLKEPDLHIENHG